MKQKLLYITDIVKGPSLSITSTDRGWVEYAKEKYNVYASKTFPVDLYKKIYSVQLDAYEKAGYELLENVGFVSHLEHVLSEKGFLLPLFAILEKERLHLTCGNSRFLAHMSSGLDPSALGLVIFSKEKINRDDLVELNTSQDFIDLYKLAEIDFSIGMTQEDGQLTVGNSSLRHTFYNDVNPGQHSHIKRLDKDIRQFWKNYVNEDSELISIKIHCLPEHREFVNKSPLFDIKFIDESPDAWEFSFGRLLGAFRPDENQKIVYTSHMTLWLFNPTEKFDLEVFIPLLNVNHTCLYTKNQKAVLFNTNSYSDFKIVGNIVK